MLSIIKLFDNNIKKAKKKKKKKKKKEIKKKYRAQEK
jgi:hypothetical protein